jgi:hypothetical protein
MAGGLGLGDEPFHRINASKEHALQLIGSVRDGLKPSGDAGNAEGMRPGLALLRHVPGAAYLLDDLTDASTACRSWATRLSTVATPTPSAVG